jgi:drug/metabolite transporter (DMT)-like permease
MSLLAKISPHTDARSAHLSGIGLMLLSVFMFSFGDALGKFIVATYSVGQLLSLRACAALLVLSPMVWRQRAQFASIERPRLQALRVVLSTVEVAAFFMATVYLPLADVITYYLACPIFVTALSALILRERVGWRRWSAILIGFCGVLIALRPSAQSISAPAMIALGGSLCF